MTTGVFLMVIGAALLHAVWNALVKSEADKTIAMAAVVIGQGLFAAPTLLVVPVPDMASLPFIASSILLHIGYQLFLMHAYRVGDLTQVYPIARGSAPLLVAAVTVWVLGEELGTGEVLGIALIAVGILSLTLVRRQDGLRNGSAAAFALATGAFIAAYSLNDGLGARLAGTALGFYGWSAIGNMVFFGAIMGAWRPALFREVPRAWRHVLIGGGASYVAYAMVVFAFTQAPIALVTALRETSIVFALLIGVLHMRERLDLAKVLSTALTLTGAIMLRLSRP